MPTNVIAFPSDQPRSLTITACEIQAAARWASRMKGGWGAGRLPTDQPGVQALEIGRNGELEWMLARTADGIVVHALAGLEEPTLGVWPTIEAALAAVEEDLAG